METIINNIGASHLKSIAATFYKFNVSGLQANTIEILTSRLFHCNGHGNLKARLYNVSWRNVPTSNYSNNQQDAHGKKNR